MFSQQDFSISLIAKMAARLLLAAIAAKASGVMTLPPKDAKRKVLFRVVCGRFTLQFATSDLDPSPSRSRRSDMPLLAGPGSTSTETAPPDPVLPLLDVSSSTEPRGNGLQP